MTYDSDTACKPSFDFDSHFKKSNCNVGVEHVRFHSFLDTVLVLVQYLG